MSGDSEILDCPRCKSKGTFHWSQDWKPVNVVAGECVACGFKVYTVFTVMKEEERKQWAEDYELPFKKKRVENERTKEFDETWGVDTDERYVIISTTEKDDETGKPLYWSNDDGWVDLGSATRFSSEEKKKLNLPVGGKWWELL